MRSTTLSDSSVTAILIYMPLSLRYINVENKAAGLDESGFKRVNSFIYNSGSEPVLANSTSFNLQKEN